MHQIEEGTVLLGFTAQENCERCNNKSYFQIREHYLKQRVFFVPIHPTKHSAIFSMCPVCENRRPLTKSMAMFASSEKIGRVLELLESGKDATKHWYAQLSPKDKEAALKRLNGIKAYALVRYLGG
jgi:hypothetical protein